MDGITTAALYYSDWGDDKGVSTNDGLKWIHLDFNGGERKGTHCNAVTCLRGLESVVGGEARQSVVQESSIRPVCFGTRPLCSQVINRLES